MALAQIIRPLTSAHQAASVWRDRCLLRNGSLFHDASIWTVPNLEALQRDIADKPVQEKETFRQKLREQLDGAPDIRMYLAAEMVWLLMLFPSARVFTGDTKRTLIRDVLGPHPMAATSDVWMTVLDEGVGHPGRAYVQRPDRELAYLVDAVIRLKRNDHPSWFVGQPWAIARLLDAVPGGDRRPMRHVLLNLLFPDVFEGIISAEHRKDIVSAFAERLQDFRPDVSDTPLMNTDRQILHIRLALEAERGEPVDFYDTPIQALWQPPAPARPSPPRTRKTKTAAGAPAPAPAHEPGTDSLRFTVDADELNVRAGPAGSEPPVPGSPLARGTVVRVLESQGAWRRVAADGPEGPETITGWVPEAFLNVAEAGPEEDGTLPAAQARAIARAAVSALAHDHVGTGLLKPEDDQLDILPEVRALCHVLVSERSRPPISVGLFGDWGTGKSFFMELMHEYIGTLSGLSRVAVQKGEESAFCTDVVQIRFNAWHYMDSNLWASLAARIFDGLGAHVAAKEPDKRAALASRLAESEGVLAQMRTERVAAESEARRCRDEFRRLNQERRAARGRLGRSVGSALTAGFARLADDASFQERLRQAERELGLPAKSLSAEEVGRYRAELRSGAARVKLAWERRPTPWRLMLIACFLVPAGLAALAAWKWDAISGWLTLAAGAAGGIAAAGRMMAPWIARVRRGAGMLEQADEAVQRQIAVEEQKLRDAELADQHEIRRLDDAARAALRAEDEAKKAADEIRAEMEELRSGRQLQRFLRDRGTSDDYRRHLGIVSLIRNDFERLSELLRGLKNDGPQPGMPHIDRIILYIDDLDRCPEHRVVEVLQAVHLLLAFPLFVVVVGVDSRWLLLSLEDHYSALRGRSRGKGAPPRRLSTPQNYLEKIFQIPFTLRRMEPDGFGRLIGSLVNRPPLVPPIGAGTAVVEPPAEPGADAGGGMLPDAGFTADPGRPERTGDEFDDVDPEAGDEPSAFDLMPPSLELEPWEAAFMAALHPLIGSPRSAKRFVNVYQFIRARLDGEALERFRGSASGGEYQVAALLLAALIGFPRESGPLFARLQAAAEPDEPWWVLVDEATAVPEPADGRIRFAAALRAVRSHCTFADRSAPFRAWVPGISRFSFHAGHAGTER